MCIIIANTTGQKLDEDMLHTAWLSNPHGGGITFPNYDQERVKILKGLMTWEKFIAAYRSLDLEGIPHLIHFRVKTSGKTDAANTHPFRVSPYLSMVHNGMLDFYHDSIRSDTRCFTEDFLKTQAKYMGSEYLMWDAGFEGIIEAVLGNSKICLMDHNGVIQIFGESKGHWGTGNEETVWFSNHTYKTVRAKFQKSKAPSCYDHGVEETQEEIEAWWERLERERGMVENYGSFHEDVLNTPPADLSRDECMVLQKAGYYWRIAEQRWAKDVFQTSPMKGRVKDEDMPDIHEDPFEYQLAQEAKNEGEARKRQAEMLARGREMSKHTIIQETDGSRYSIKRCDLSLELNQTFGVNWTMLEHLKDDDLMRIAQEQGVFQN